LSSKGYILRAKTSGANSYRWQDGSTADSFKVTTPGQYNVTISFGSCTVRDTVNISGAPPPVLQATDMAICSGMSLTLPWGKVVDTAGIYHDTLRYAAGCDSLIRKVTVTTA
jgi:hypothetical protein